MTYVVRTEGDPALLARPIAARLGALDPDLPMAKVRPLEHVVQRASAGARFTTLLAGIFGGAALLLAAIGLYGTLAYSVQQRSHEIGVRMALGAGSRQVLRLVIGRGLRAALIGLGLGVVGAIWLGRFLAGLLYGVTPTDGLTYGTVALLLLAVALLGSWIPARRATRLDPLLCLRCE
jgi:ABC-type antimicrobial peptide transport system permease subunit